jgi:glutathione S-transferase
MIRECGAYYVYRKHIFPKLGIETDPLILADAENCLPKSLDVMEQWLTETGNLVNSDLTICDLIGYTSLSPLWVVLGFNFAKWPKVNAWVHKLWNNPVFEEIEADSREYGRLNGRLTVYTFPASVPANAVVLLCKLAGIPYETEVIDITKGEGRSPEYLALNPAGSVPTITAGWFTLSESLAILQYLSELESVDDKWYPAEPKARAHVDSFMHWFQLNFRR